MWFNECLHQNLEKVINRLQSWREVYWILVRIQDGYMGPSPKVPLENRKTEIFENKNIISTRIIVTDEKPLIPLLGTALWEINNKIGEAKCLWILPQDKPIMRNLEDHEGSKFVFDSGVKTNIPTIFN